MQFKCQWACFKKTVHQTPPSPLWILLWNIFCLTLILSLLVMLAICIENAVKLCRQNWAVLAWHSHVFFNFWYKRKYSLSWKHQKSLQNPWYKTVSADIYISRCHLFIIVHGVTGRWNNKNVTKGWIRKNLTDQI